MPRLLVFHSHFEIHYTLMLSMLMAFLIYYMQQNLPALNASFMLRPAQCMATPLKNSKLNQKRENFYHPMRQISSPMNSMLRPLDVAMGWKPSDYVILIYLDQDKIQMDRIPL